MYLEISLQIFVGSGAYVAGSGGPEVQRRGAPPPDPWMQGAYVTSDVAAGGGSQGKDKWMDNFISKSFGILFSCLIYYT